MLDNKDIQKINRIEWIDIAKGIGIILVAIGHIFSFSVEGPIGYFAKWIYSFHMPLFFFLSGLTFNIEKYDLKSLMKNKFYTLLLPYIFFSLLAYLVFVMGYFANDILGLNISKFSDFGIIKPFIGIFYAKIHDNFLPFVMQPLWFLPCLFILHIFYYLLKKIIKNDFFLLILLLGFSLVIYFFNKWFLPLSFDSMIMVLPFFHIAVIFRNRVFKVESWNNKIILGFISIILLIINFITVKFNSLISVAINSFGNYFLFYIGAFSGIFFILIIAMIIKSNKLLSFFGVNSLVVFVTHMIIIFVIEGILIVLLGVSFDGISNSLILCILVTCLTMIVQFPVIFVINKYMPFLLGKIRLKK